MKLSISLPNEMALEMKRLAEELDRPLSWIVQKVWERGRRLFTHPPQTIPHPLKKTARPRSPKEVFESFRSLEGCLKDCCSPGTTSVALQKTAFDDVD